MRCVIGDIHGRHEALKEVLEKSKFDKEKDILIVLGDVVDGGYNIDKVIEELLTIKNLTFVFGNHDSWFMDYTFKGTTPSIWINQGGANTLNSYGGDVKPSKYISATPEFIDIHGVKIPKTHVEFFSKGLYYFEFDGMVFVHGGFDPNKPIAEQDKEVLLWDRDLIKYADNNTIPNYKKVFIGHTSTQNIERNWANYLCRDCEHEWEKEVKIIGNMYEKPICEKCKSENIFQSLGCTKPIKIGNLYMLDCGCGWNGKLALMDIDTEEYWLSKLQEPAIIK